MTLKHPAGNRMSRVEAGFFQILMKKKSRVVTLNDPACSDCRLFFARFSFRAAHIDFYEIFQQVEPERGSLCDSRSRQ